MKNFKSEKAVKNELIQNRVKLLLLEMQYYGLTGNYDLVEYK